ncbi:MAG: serine/threonine-protein phosphatase [Phycisphaerales bacterium]|nr:serine/threonine-protein phosphatase [Phycisphaerales bacterium]
MTASVTADFRDEWLVERSALLRRRFLRFTTVVSCLLMAQLAGTITLRITGNGPISSVYAWANIIEDVLILALFIAVNVITRRRQQTYESVLRTACWLIIITGGIVLLPLGVITGGSGGLREAYSGVGSVFLLHFFASLFLSWTPREALRPLVPLVILNALVMPFMHIEVGPMIGVLVLSLFIGIPGLIIAAWRHTSLRSRFHFRMLKGHYGQMKREFGEARQIHESLFPHPLREGPIRFDYRYLPMRQIGGDYLFARLDRRGVLHVVLIDVTGHGLSAALTVNRLAGEIERQLGESPDVGPAALLAGLNAYVHHTLAVHSVYATALCIQVDCRADQVRWASAGHPPAFLRAVDGSIESLDSTTIVLGACHGDDFPMIERTARFGRGDTILAYTDGAIEATNADGRMLRIDGLQRMLASGHPDRDGGWTASLMREVDRFREGPIQDDTLMVEVWRPVTVQAGQRAAVETRGAAEVSR